MSTNLKGCHWPSHQGHPLKNYATCYRSECGVINPLETYWEFVCRYLSVFHLKAHSAVCKIKLSSLCIVLRSLGLHCASFDLLQDEHILQALEHFRHSTTLVKFASTWLKCQRFFSYCITVFLYNILKYKTTTCIIIFNIHTFIYIIWTVRVSTVA